MNRIAFLLSLLVLMAGGLLVVSSGARVERPGRGDERGYEDLGAGVQVSVVRTKTTGSGPRPARPPGRKDSRGRDAGTEPGAGGLGSRKTTSAASGVRPGRVPGEPKQGKTPRKSKSSKYAADPLAHEELRRRAAQRMLRTHVVRAGETLHAIARLHHGSGASWKRILAANPGTDPRRLRVGSRLAIPWPLPPEVPQPPRPAGRGAPAVVHTVKSGETLFDIARRHYGSGTYWPTLVDANPGIDPWRLKPGRVLRVPRLRPAPVR